MQARYDLDESEDVIAHMYYHSLRLDMQHFLAFQNFETVDKVVQHAMKA